MSSNPQKNLGKAGVVTLAVLPDQYEAPSEGPIVSEKTFVFPD